MTRISPYLAALALFVGTQTRADLYSWKGGALGLFSSPSNWNNLTNPFEDPHEAPGIDDDALITDGNVFIAGAATRSATVGGFTTFNLPGSYSITNGLWSSGSLDVVGTGFLSANFVVADGFFNIFGSTVNVDTVMYIHGNSMFTADALLNLGSLVVNQYGENVLTVVDAKLNTGAYGSDVIGYDGLGGTMVISGASSMWVNRQAIKVGYEESGKLLMLGGAKVGSSIDSGGTFGSAIGGNINPDGSYHYGSGFVQVGNPGTTWTDVGGIDVGVFGTGTLAIQDGGQVTANVSLADAVDTFNGPTIINPAGDGNVLVTGADSRLFTEFLRVGVSGHGVALVENGGGISATQRLEVGVHGIGLGDLFVHANGQFVGVDGVIGVDPGSTGQIVVDGNGAQFGLTGQFEIGAHGNGALYLYNGGQVTTHTTRISTGTGGTLHYGTAVVNGANTTWVNAGDLTVGVGANSVGTLTVENAGHFTVGGAVAIGDDAMSYGTATVASGGVWSIAQELVIGDASTGLVTVRNESSRLTVAAGKTVTLGRQAGGFGGATVEAGGEWEVDGNLVIGLAGTGTLDVRENASMSVAANRTVTMGSEAGGFGGANIRTGGTWEIAHDLVIGKSGTGVLEIVDENSRVAVEGPVTLGQNTGGYGTAEVRSGGTWEIAEELFVGQSAFGAATVRDGGTVIAENEVLLGVNANGYGILNLIGSDAQFELNGVAAITVGIAGRGELHLSEGAAFTSSSHVALGEEAGSNGSATVGGEESTWFAGDLTVGAAGAGSVVVSNGGTIDSQSVTFGEANGASGTGTVSNGGAIFSQSVTFGEAQGASGSGTVTGTGSLWTIGSQLAVGGGGTANLLVESGGKLAVGAPEIIIGEESTGKGVFTLSSASAVLDFEGDLVVGKRGDGAFGLQGGANYTAHNITLGEVTGSSGTLSANASTLVVLEELTVGDGGEGAVNLTAAASLNVFGDAVLAEKIGSHATATIDSGSTWQANSITVAAQGIAGVNVKGGGQMVALVDMVVAEHAGSGGTVGVDGAASSLRAAGFHLGGSAEFPSETGGSAAVSVTNDGRIFVSHELATLAHATIDATGGRVTVGNDAPLAEHGSLRVNHDGVLAGTGTIKGAVFNAACEVAPGHEELPGTLFIEGNFSQAVAGHLKFDIAGEAPPEGDRLNITGSAILRGTLEALFLDGFVPELGDSFALLFAAGGVNMAFDHFELPDLEAGLKWRLSVPATTLTLSVVTRLSGDYNENGIVDAADYVVWRDTFGQSVLMYNGADGDGDGTVGNNDYDVWRAHHGETAGSGAGGSISVPEPVSYALLISAAAVLTVVSPGKMSPRIRR